MCRIRTFGLSPNVQLAVELLLAFCAFRQGHVASTSELARRSRLARWQVDKLSTRLRLAGIIRGVRGPRGGFSLSRAPEDVSLACIVDAIDGQDIPTRSPSARADAHVEGASNHLGGSESLELAVRRFFAALSLRQIEELVSRPMDVLPEAPEERPDPAPPVRAPRRGRARGPAPLTGA